MPSVKGASVRFLVDPEDRYVVDENDCWLWQGPIDKDGYGTLTGDKWHRYMWKKYKGSIPEGHGVLHKCDVRRCGNPEHLFTGTPRDNHDDMVQKGRRVEPMLGRKQPPHVGAAVADSNRRRALSRA